MSDTDAPRRGLVHVYTGDGKGKTTAALGLALRAAGQGFKVIIIQFVKSNPNCGEHLFVSNYHPFEIVQLAEGDSFTMAEEDLRQATRKALTRAEEVLRSDEYQMVILDEIFVALNRGWLDSSEVIDLMSKKSDSVELILTGRKAPMEIVRLADLATEMLMIKHPFSKGIKARKGIEY
ncbi:MAG: cob(I)yrinic acid a,c-diamide adenosyltransferase [Dehalococcoidia bacterium]|nr:Cob(I)yrinic acid a,c-diamide adenosyltransferase [Chloroflexota bacterium]MBT9162552.1 Cob(I)yrinic acid a,c-diamide adenosyltransferase [Chloroflexota bacterium]